MPREVLGQLGQLQPEPQVRLVRPVPVHRVAPGDPRHRSRHLVAGELPPQRGDDLLRQRDDVVLVDERHLDVQLGELRLPVGAEVLVPVAAGDLVVPLHPGDHQQLLEQLRRLRQRVPGARAAAAPAPGSRARPPEWSGSASGSRSPRSPARPAPAGDPVGLRPQPQRRRRTGPAQVQVAVPEPDVLADVDVVVDRERQRRRLGEHLQLVATTSISPVGRSGFSLPSGRRRTVPVTRMQYSLRSSCAASLLRNTTCTTPDASRRSMKITPPWSRRRATQPARVTVLST